MGGEAGGEGGELIREREMGREREDGRESEMDVSWCFEPSQPLGITTGLREGRWVGRGEIAGKSGGKDEMGSGEMIGREEMVGERGGG